MGAYVGPRAATSGRTAKQCHCGEMRSPLDGWQLLVAPASRRRRTSAGPPSGEACSNKGRDFAPALIALTEWGDR